VQFGTDGIRGRAYDDVTVEVAFRLGIAVSTVFPDVTVFVGYDTRESSLELCQGVLDGLRAGGSTAVNLGVIPTPGVAVIAQERSGAGIVISASHNPYYDNGLKVFGVGGVKLDHETEERVQAAFDLAVVPGEVNSQTLAIDDEARRRYFERLLAIVPQLDLRSLFIVVDCAHGAASDFAPKIFRQLGARVEVLCAAPTGRNINDDCGSTHPEKLARRVVELGADFGVAFDGDADRLIAVDATGEIRDGDDLMVLFAADRERRGVLGGQLVVTSMSNLGLRRAMAEKSIAIIETDVGDRNVLMALEERNLDFGGEQSGHLIFRDLAPTGDGLLTALLLSDLVAREGSLSAISSALWRRMPQRLINIPVEAYDESAVPAAWANIQKRFALSESDVRIVVRPSGTEPVVRVMIEAPQGEYVDVFCELVREACS